MRCCHSTHSLLFRDSLRVAGGSAAVCGPNPSRPFARSRENGVPVLKVRGQMARASRDRILKGDLRQKLPSKSASFQGFALEPPALEGLGSSQWMQSQELAVPFIRGSHGGVGKRGGGKPHEGHPSQNAFVWYVFHPSQVSLLCLSCTQIHD